MARMSRKEKIWEEFASALAKCIAEKFMQSDIEAATSAIKDHENKLHNDYYLPIKKLLDKLPEGAAYEDNYVNLRTDKNKQGIHLRFDEVKRVPRYIIVPQEMIDRMHSLHKEKSAVDLRHGKLYNDLFNNIVAAESFAEVVDKWPEAKELAEECALSHATTMNTPLAKILGKYAPTALPAPAEVK